MTKDSLGDRMKEYERAASMHLTKRTPCIIRLDGVAFHTFTKGLRKPFDDGILLEAMRMTMRDLCEDIQGVVFGYTQSDEITLILQDYKNLETAAWFDKNVQKMVSVAAAKAALYFNRNFAQLVEDSLIEDLYVKDIYRSKLWKAVFDARVFCLPESEVTNCLIWRQQDAIRNSIQSVAQISFSEKEMYKLNTKQLKEKLLAECKYNWDELVTHLQRGSCCYKADTGEQRPQWFIDKNIPIFTEDRDYIEKHFIFD